MCPAGTNDQKLPGQLEIFGERLVVAHRSARDELRLIQVAVGIGAAGHERAPVESCRDRAEREHRCGRPRVPLQDVPVPGERARQRRRFHATGPARRTTTARTTGRIGLCDLTATGPSCTVSPPPMAMAIATAQQATAAKTSARTAGSDSGRINPCAARTGAEAARARPRPRRASRSSCRPRAIAAGTSRGARRWCVRP